MIGLEGGEVVITIGSFFTTNVEGAASISVGSETIYNHFRIRIWCWNFPVVNQRY